MSSWLLWLHLSGIIISLGSAVLIVGAVYPGTTWIEDKSQRFMMIAGILKYFHPLFLFGICLIFMTGAIGLTDLKIDLGTAYYTKIGSVLLQKFGLTMLIFLFGSMQCVGTGLRVARMANGVIESDEPTKTRYLMKIYRTTIINIILLAVTLYIGLKLPGAIAAGS